MLQERRVGSVRAFTPVFAGYVRKRAYAHPTALAHPALL